MSGAYVSKVSMGLRPYHVRRMGDRFHRELHAHQAIWHDRIVPSEYVRPEYTRNMGVKTTLDVQINYTTYRSAPIRP